MPNWFAKAKGYTKNEHDGELSNLRDDRSQKANRYAELPKKVAERRAELDRIKGKYKFGP